MKLLDHIRRLVVALAFAVSLLAACGDDDEQQPAEQKPSPKTETAEETKALSARDIESKLKQSVGGGVSPRVTSVSCPPYVKPVAGQSFSCTASGEQGIRGTIKVTPQSDKGIPSRYKGKLKGPTGTLEVRGIIE
jgi:hypothetical protein